MLKPALALAAIVAASFLVAPTVSQAATTNSVRISYADLNLATLAGQHHLQGRIASGARVVCEIEDSRQTALQRATNLCRGDAIDSARPAYEAAVAAARHGEVLVGAALTITAP